MEKHNAANERIKRQYLIFLKDSQGRNEATIDAVAKSINRFEVYTKFKSFKKFHIEQARGFKRYLGEQDSKQTGKKLSKATIHATLIQLKRFFLWLAWQPGYKSRIQSPDVEYFNLNDKDTRIATASRPQRVPTIEQIKKVIDKMPATTEIEWRNRALVAFTLLTGARDSAIASLKLKHVDLIGGYVDQDAREVKTKFSKTFRTYFFPVGEEIREIVSKWVSYLLEEKFYGNDDPLFPATLVAQGADKQFGPAGFARRHWRTTTPIRRIFQEAFEQAGMPYFNPHSFRFTLATLGEKVCNTPEDFKAWSQNMGHEHVMTTFNYYGPVPDNRQGEILRDLAKPEKPMSEIEAYEGIKKLLKGLQESGIDLQSK